MNEYIVHTTTYGGNRGTMVFSNKRKAKSFAWQWINNQKRICRDRGNSDYGETHVVIRVYSGHEFDNNHVIAFYD